MAEIDAALPLPTGDPETLRTRAGHFHHASAAATQTVLAREAPAGLGLATVWAGPAHDAALAEAGTAARLINEVAGRFGPAAAAVRGFADALEIARRTVAALREEWLAADRHQAAAVHEQLPLATDPAAQVEVARAAAARRERCRSDLLTRYAACMRNLEAAETTAAHAVSGTLGEAVSPAGQRLLLLSQLPVSAVAARQAEAVALVDRVLSGVGGDPHGWSAQQIEQVVLALGDHLADRLVVRALMDRLGVDGLEHASRLLWHETDPTRTGAPTEGSDSARQALDLLARAFAGSVSEAPASDPASAALLDQWRAGWLGQLLSSTTSGLTAQLMLVSAAAAGPSRTVPGYGYAVGALRALLAGSGPLTPQFDLSGVYTNGRISADILQGRDPYQLLFSSLGADPALARRVLLSEGTTGRTLLHELVVERPLQSASTADPLTSSAALGRLVLDLAEAPDSTSAAHAEFAGAFLDALGERARKEVSRKGYFEFPYQVPRWAQAAGEVYGRGLGEATLADVRTLNQQSRTAMVSAQKAADPPLAAPHEGVIRQARTFPGGITYGAIDANGNMLLRPLHEGGNPRLTLEMMEQRRALDPRGLLLLADADGRHARHDGDRMDRPSGGEAAPDGPKSGPHSERVLVAADQAPLRHAVAARMLPPPPQEIQRMGLTIEYVSPLAKAQMASEAQSIVRLYQSLMPIAQADPSVLDNVDHDEAARALARGYAVPAPILRDAREVDDRRNERSQAQAQAAMLGSGQAVADIAQKLARANAMTAAK